MGEWRKDFGMPLNLPRGQMTQEEFSLCRSKYNRCGNQVASPSV